MNNYLRDRDARKKADDETISSLLKHGANLNNEYLIDFFFIGNTNNLKKIEDILITQGYKKYSQSKENELHMQQLINLNLMQDHLITESLESIANENNTSFDGWGTVVN